MDKSIAGKKRKSKVAESEGTAAKKVKADKPADLPAPLKSALKKTARDVSKWSARSAAMKAKEEEKSKTTESTKAKTASKKESSDSKKSKPTKSKASEDHVALDLASDDEGDHTTELTSDQTAALLAGFSSDEEEEDVPSDTDAIPISKIPSAPTTGLIQKRIRLAIAEQDDPETTPGVLYIGRLPHGFYEHQLQAYLSQFGEVLHLRLARNKKTGKSQHYAFAEFASAAVAEIVAKTMDKYLLFGHLLQVRKVPRDLVKENMFQGAGKRFKKAPPRNRMERGALRRGMLREGWEKRIGKEEERRTERAKKLEEMGYEFAMPAVKKVSEVPVKPKEIEGTGEEEEVKALPAAEEEVVVEEKGDEEKSKKRASSGADAKKTKKAKRVKA